MMNMNAVSNIMRAYSTLNHNIMYKVYVRMHIN